jgi:uracil-DNA glycosylase
MENEIAIVNPKVIILFGNQVSSIFLKEKISVSTSRKKKYIKEKSAVKADTS